MNCTEPAPFYVENDIAIRCLSSQFYPMDVQDILDLASAHWKTATLHAGVTLGVFDALAGNPSSAAQVASHCNASERHTASLLDSLVGLEVLEKSNDTYTLPENLARILSTDGADSMALALQFNAQMMPLWAKLGDCVKAGAPPVPANAQLGADPARVSAFVRGMHSRARALGPEVIKHLDLTGVGQLLDVAAGPGTFSVLLAEAYPELHTTVFDLPAVSAVSQELHADSAVRDRITFAAGDYHVDPLPEAPAGGYDAVFYSGAVHQEDIEHTRIVLSKIYNALKPGGRLLLMDLMLESDRTLPAYSALFDLHMMLTNSMSHVHTVDGVSDLVREAGFESLESRELARTPYHLVQAIRGG